MLLSTGIKNAILIVLIILILHFLIKNYLFDKKPRVVQSPSVHVSNVVDVITPQRQLGVVLVDDPQKPNTTKIPYPFDNKKQDHICDNETQKDYLKNELLDFVYGKEDSNINKFYADDPLSTPVKDLEERISKQNMSCLKPDDNRLPLSTTCDDKIQTLDFKAADMPIKADCDLLQDQKNSLILKEYEDDNDMNTGKLYGGTLLANDDFNVNYSSF